MVSTVSSQQQGPGFESRLEACCVEFSHSPQLPPQHKELHGVTMGNLRCECERRLNTKNIKLLLDTDVKKK